MRERTRRVGRTVELSRAPARARLVDRESTRQNACDLASPAGASDNFVNRQSARQAHETSGAKCLVWPVEPKRADEPIIRSRLRSTVVLHYHSTTRAWPVAARGFVGEQPHHRAGVTASTSTLSLTIGSPSSGMHGCWNVNARARCANRRWPNWIG